MCHEHQCESEELKANDLNKKKKEERGGNEQKRINMDGDVKLFLAKVTAS